MPTKKVEIKPATPKDQEVTDIINVLFEDIEIDLEDDMEIVFELDLNSDEDDDWDEDDDEDYQATNVSIYSIN